MRRLAALGVLGALLCLGCGSGYDHLDLEQKTLGRGPIEIASDGVEIPAGVAVAVTAEPVDHSGGPLEGKVTLRLSSSHPEILGVAEAVPPDEAEGAPARWFVFIGVAAGTAEIEVVVDGAREGSIGATITAR